MPVILQQDTDCYGHVRSFPEVIIRYRQALTIHRGYTIVPIKTKVAFLPFFQRFSVHYYGSARF